MLEITVNLMMLLLCSRCSFFEYYYYIIMRLQICYRFVLFFYSKLKKLSEDSLTKQPEEVFDVLEKLGEG